MLSPGFSDAKQKGLKHMTDWGKFQLIESALPFNHMQELQNHNKFAELLIVGKLTVLGSQDTHSVMISPQSFRIHIGKVDNRTTHCQRFRPWTILYAWLCGVQKRAVAQSVYAAFIGSPCRKSFIHRFNVPVSLTFATWCCISVRRPLDKKFWWCGRKF